MRCGFASNLENAIGMKSLRGFKDIFQKNKIIRQIMKLYVKPNNKRSYGIYKIDLSGVLD